MPVRVPARHASPSARALAGAADGGINFRSRIRTNLVRLKTKGCEDPREFRAERRIGGT